MTKQEWAEKVHALKNLRSLTTISLETVRPLVNAVFELSAAWQKEWQDGDNRLDENAEAASRLMSISDTLPIVDTRQVTSWEEESIAWPRDQFPRIPRVVYRMVLGKYLYEKDGQTYPMQEHLDRLFVNLCR